MLLHSLIKNTDLKSFTVENDKGQSILFISSPMPTFIPFDCNNKILYGYCDVNISITDIEDNPSWNIVIAPHKKIFQYEINEYVQNNRGYFQDMVDNFGIQKACTEISTELLCLTPSVIYNALVENNITEVNRYEKRRQNN